MYDQPGDRVRVQNTTKKGIANGAPAVLGGHVGFVEKNTQPDRWVKPDSEEATHVMPEEFCVLFVDDCHLLPLAGGLSGAKVGDKVYIDDAQNVLLKPGEGEGAKNEVQEVTVKAKKGKISLVFDGEETAEVAFNVTAKELEEALNALSNIEAGDVTVTGGVGDEGGTKPYVVTFGGQYAGTDVPALKAGAKKGEEPGEITVTTKTAGVAGKTAHPLGVIDSIDTAPTPDEALVNLADLKPFLTV